MPWHVEWQRNRSNGSIAGAGLSRVESSQVKAKGFSSGKLKGVIDMKQVN